MKNSPRVNVKVAVLQKDEAVQRLMRVAMLAFVVMGVAVIVELQVAVFLALAF
jgi:hypothetical protein